ncbi:MAG: rod shape-determining protein RodA [Sulfurimonas sp. RIFOXYD12_FULL_33_39]|uniref:FtsW/RodA/SpoVE family cell cycle protein n=1 Tax=unclassified Sulfurimonas TaxID=2623549 RepID=UPI0008B48194|nr:MULTISPECIES: FtsW/RodA/SpoVE family cell cycle protein [unclassified Sulfurimonas]OHE07438.1 MAG: rod shape-determining protein RodA [Sulfurimonas sp. RIFCSPLOWO2_12_FULL_34_6]OHE08900.1 MAG: rod shape-determining protein RodA [Sulfurimonas sp. RIFOXYD12_FULL_33_39]OHE14210.1 MAG: rod shape-determining protein RodA [Sulfurimonas sp. RIFOXYD2_FULL_34_21]
MWRIDKRILAQFDFFSIILIIPLIITSNWLIGEVVPALAQKQMAYVGVAVLVFFGVFLLPIRRMSWLIPLIYWINIILLLAVEFLGHARLGAQRWIEIPFINATIQPSEFVKPALILMLAYLIHKNPPPMNGYKIKEFLKISFYILLPFILIAKEPDLGTALVLLLIGYGVLFFIGVQWKIWAVIVGSILLISPLAYKFLLHDYQKTRIQDFLSEKPSYHVQQSIIAIGSGGISGKSKDDATQTQMRFLPISTSDFIFAFLVERSGFLGALGIILIYVTLILHLMSLSIFNNDYYIKVVTISISFMIFIYTGVNISMTIGYAPVVGVPLPMFSYGGSSFINFIILFAIMQNLIAFRYRDMYDGRGTKSFL